MSKFSRTATFLLSATDAAQTIQLGGPWNRLVITNRGAVAVGLGFITFAQDAADMTSYATAHKAVDAGYSFEVNVLASALKYITETGTATIEVVALT